MRRHLIALSSAVALLWTVALVPAAADEKLGAGVTLAEATSIDSLYTNPEAYVGKKVRVDGIVTSVCTAMGCWMALAPEGKPDQAVRFQVDHDGAIVFPVTAKGKHASAEGVFTKIATGDHEANEAAREHAAASPGGSSFGMTYQVHGTGAIIR